jgi:hypothetical protein
MLDTNITISNGIAMQLNPKFPVQLKKVYINELVALLNLVNNHLTEVDQSYKKIKDKELNQAYRHVRVVCKRWNEKVNEMQLTGRTTYTLEFNYSNLFHYITFTAFW